MNCDVVCVGQCAWDLLAVVEKFPQPGSKTEALDLFQQGGGPAATAAVTLARLGVNVAFVGKVGNDSWGRKIVAGLAEGGVGTQGLIVERGESSPLSFVTVEKSTGKRTIVHNRGTVRSLAETDLKGELIRSAKILLIDSLYPEAARSAAKTAKEKSIRIVLDTGSFKPQAADLLAMADVVVAPEYFATEYAPERDIFDIGRKLLELGPEIVVVTQGDRGGLCFSRSEEFAYPGFDVEVVDTTGAGDVFHGAYAYGLLQEWDLKKTATFASAVAALKCTKLGGRTGIPSLHEALDFLREK